MKRIRAVCVETSRPDQRCKTFQTQRSFFDMFAALTLRFLFTAINLITASLPRFWSSFSFTFVHRVLKLQVCFKCDTSDPVDLWWYTELLKDLIHLWWYQHAFGSSPSLPLSEGIAETSAVVCEVPELHVNKSSRVVVLSATNKNLLPSVVSGSERQKVSEAEPQNLRILNQSDLKDRTDGDSLHLCDHSFIWISDIVFVGNHVAVNVSSMISKVCGPSVKLQNRRWLVLHYSDTRHVTCSCFSTFIDQQLQEDSTLTGSVTSSQLSLGLWRLGSCRTSCMDPFYVSRGHFCLTF